MKKNKTIYLLFFAALMTTDLLAQSSTIYFYRPKNFFGRAVGTQIKVGNQKTFSLENNESAKFTLNSTGRVVITAGPGPMGVTSEEWLKVEAGKEYFFEFHITKKNGLVLIDKPKELPKWASNPSYNLVEDKEYPINKSPN
jgi:hypothetical protein